MVQNFQEVPLCGQKKVYYAISLEYISIRILTVIRFTTILEISEALHDVFQIMHFVN